MLLASGRGVARGTNLPGVKVNLRDRFLAGVACAAARGISESMLPAAGNRFCLWPGARIGIEFDLMTFPVAKTCVQNHP
jgi:hypothetical protein